MKTQAIALIALALFATHAKAEYKTPGIDSPINPGHDITVADINEPEVGEGSTPNGVSADQVFQEGTADDSLLIPVTAGVDNNDPELSVDGTSVGGRKMLSGRKMLDTLQLSGNGVQAGEDGNGVTTTLAGNGGGNVFDESYINGVASGENPLDYSDAHVQPHQDTTTVTADGQSITTGAGVDPDQLGGENNDGLVYTVPGRK